MTTNWPAVGDDVVVLQSLPGASHATAARHTVLRVTKTQIVTDKGHRFRRDRLTGVGETTYGPRNELVRPDDPRAITAFDRQLRRNTVHAVDRLLREWAEKGDPRTAQKAVATIELALRRIEERAV